MNLACLLILLFINLAVLDCEVVTTTPVESILLNNESAPMPELTLDDLIVDNSWMEQTLPENAVRLDIPLEIVNEPDMSFRGGMEDIDCFGLSPTLQKMFRWMFQPQAKETINTKFYLSTGANRNRTEIDANSIEKNTPNVDLKKDTVVIIHGFMSNSRMEWVRDLERALLSRPQNDINVISVDWGGGSMSWKYWRAVGNTREVGKATAELLQEILKKGLRRELIHCIGHSLGAHICSYTANKLGFIGRITGLDPAQPCFDGKGLNASDAIYVDVVHTNAALLNKVGLGIPRPIGTIDFFPNGGQKQPGCVLRGVSNFQSWLPGVRQELEGAICSHGRSYQVFIDSIRLPDCHFWGRAWDLSENGALTSLTKACTPMKCVPMGLRSKEFPGRGSYFVPTLEKSPYCIQDENAEKQMGIWKRIQTLYANKLRKLQKKWETLKL